MRLGLNLAAFGDRSLHQALLDAKALGVEAVEIPVHGGGPFFLSEEVEVEPIVAAVNAARALDLDVSALDNHVDSHGLMAKGSEDSLAGRNFTRTMRAAGEAGVPLVTCFFGEAPGSHWFLWPHPEERTSAFRHLARIWKPYLKHANRLDVHLAHEPHPRQSAFDLESCLRLEEALDGDPAFAINLDVGNLLLSHGDPLEFLRHLGGRVAHLHAKDFRPQRQEAKRDWSFAIAGSGVAEWTALADAMLALNADVVWSLEHEDPRFERTAGVELGLRFLRALQQEPATSEVWW
ncbi:MAG: sugar phosphate isomerase/epimerase family protein [Planctomycetota bacterium]